ncbi:hypothetical protein BSZ39_05915 [Bowdeniella nasicola]|uniref:DNA topoisomerase I catalytic core eukaryotic-type domain-containing protein n=1 Tax=Bowdeniella nasicola TaxID=208480 RepID=A0A1Q5Q2P8_9ACTO|nr:hypothetical protein [Bowdeniella nasicola]OKL54097.1 hypothetical protein BSZ39_05915 [Bowdeniella nasicola]
MRLIDKLGLRVGGSEYAKENESFGTSTLQRRHVTVKGDTVHLTFRGMSGSDWDVRTRDKALAAFFNERPKTPKSAPAVCCPEQEGRRRTWQGTVVAAQALGRAAATGDSSPQAVTAAIKQTAEWLHNTPAIARDSYINPRVIELFEKGTVVKGKATDKKVRELLT